MEITEVRIKLVRESQDRLLAFCSITFDSQFVIRDLKIIQGTKGPFVAMPSRKLMDRCRRCGGKNALRSAFCNQCGVRLQDDRAPKETDGRAKLYADIAHPINSECREMIQTSVLAAFEHEQVLAQSPDYICRYDDFGENDSWLPPEFDSVDFEIGPPPDSSAVRRSDGQVHQRIEGKERQPSQPPHEGRRSGRSTPSSNSPVVQPSDPFGQGVKDQE
ncbi:MAG: septation protein SpoVG family protein [Planctomycetaceae bacterium]